MKATKSIKSVFPKANIKSFDELTPDQQQRLGRVYELVLSLEKDISTPNEVENPKLDTTDNISEDEVWTTDEVRPALVENG